MEASLPGEVDKAVYPGASYPYDLHRGFEHVRRPGLARVNDGCEDCERGGGGGLDGSERGVACDARLTVGDGVRRVDFRTGLIDFEAIFEWVISSI